MRLGTLAHLGVIFALSFNLAAQSRGGGGKVPGGVGTNTTMPRLPDNSPNNNPARAFFLSGKVSVDDGTPLTDPAMIQSNCKGQIHTLGYTDSKGAFSLELGGSHQRELASMDQAIDSASGVSGLNTSALYKPSGSDVLSEWRECELQAALPGFTSQVVELASRMTDLGSINVGSIILHRISHVEGFTISATSAAAPSKAKKEYERGRESEKKENWDAALQSFEKAVAAYPKYAVAWLELGKVQIRKNDLAAARQSFHQSISADSKFVSPYQELAQLAVQDKQWQDVIELTNQILGLNPVSFPQFWLFNAAANYYLERFDPAEKSAMQGLNVDQRHQVPKLEYLLGLILAQKHDYTGALEHVRNYLRLSPGAPDAASAQKQVQQFEKLSTEAQKQN